MHRSVCETLSKDNRAKGPKVQRLWLWARGHFKTSIIDVAHSIYLITNNPNIRLLVTSNTIDISGKIVNETRMHFIENEEFRFFFREFVPKASKDGKIDWGTTERFTLGCRTKIYKEPTMMCAGYGTNLAGLHFDRIKADDLVTRQSVTNETQLLQSKEHFASLRSLFDNATVPRIDVIGTPYHYNDLYANLRTMEFYEKSIIPIKDKDGKIAFHERFTEDAIQELINDPTVGPYEFSSQFMLNPIDPSKMKFKEEWIKTYDEIPLGCSEYICVDPASTQTKKSDYTVIEHWCIDAEGKHYLKNGFRDKVTAFQRIDKLFEFVRGAKRLVWVKYEVLGGRHGDLEIIRQKQVTETLFFDVRETKGGKASKQDRIEQRLTGAYFSGKVYWPRSLIYRSFYDGRTHDFVSELRTEYLQFPSSEHDDILDCQAQMFEEQLVKGVAPRAVAERKNGVTADEYEKQYQELVAMKKRNPFLTKEQIQNKLKVRELNRMLMRTIA